MRVKRALSALALASLPVHAVLLWLLPGDGTWVEAFYARGVYPVIGPVVAYLPSLLPFSVAAVGIIAILIWAPAYLIVNIRRWLGNRLTLLQAAGRTVMAWAVVAICLFHGFYFFWGYNYLRPPLEVRLGLQVVDDSAEARLRTARMMVQRAVDAIVPVETWDRAELDRLIDAAIARAVRDLEGRATPVVTPLKSDLGTGYLARSGLGGAVNPLTLEAHVDFGLPPFSLAFTAAHEKAHLAGFARERDASFVAWYALTHSNDPRLRFSGYYRVAEYFMNSQTSDLSQPLMPFLLARLNYSNGKTIRPLSNVRRRVYSVYMRANRMEAGLADYGEVANLIHDWLQQPD